MLNVFNQNPFRILGIKANASAPEKQKSKSRIAAYTKVGKTPILEFDLCPPLKEINRTQELIDLKSNEILSDIDKVNHALFWFISGGTIDDIALSNLTESKDNEKALSNFEKGSQGFTINKNTICSIINHSTLDIICYPEHNNKSRLKLAFDRKLEIASSDEYISLLLGFLNSNNKYLSSRDIKKVVIENLKLLLVDLFPNSSKEKLFLEYFSNQKEIIEELKEIKSKKLIATIKSQVRLCESERKEIMQQIDRSLLVDCAEIGRDLLSNTKRQLNELKELLGARSIVVENCYEEVLSEVNYCGVSASNKFQNILSVYIRNNAETARTFIYSSGKYCYDEIVVMLEEACNMLVDINIPIKHQLKENFRIIKETKSDWINLYDTLNGTGGGTSPGGGGEGLTPMDVVLWIVVGIIFLAILSSC